MHRNPSEVALRAANQVAAMIAYWNTDQICLYSNEAYQVWFGRSPKEMRGMSLNELLGPLYEKTQPYAIAVLQGETQVFERRMILPGGQIRDGLITYTPDLVEGEVRGFVAHVADVTLLREREAALELSLRKGDRSSAPVQGLHGIISVCCHCKDIRNESGGWQSMERYFSERTPAVFSHSFCPKCFEEYYGDFVRDIPKT